MQTGKRNVDEIEKKQVYLERFFENHVMRQDMRSSYAASSMLSLLFYCLPSNQVL